MGTFKTPKLDYTSRDFVAIRDDLIKAIPFYTPEWTDTNPDDFGIVLTELFSGMGDVLHWYIDMEANENYLSTALSRQSVARLLALIGIQMKGVQAAKTSLVFSITLALGYDFVIPKGTKVQTSGLANVVVYETDENVTILTGQLVSPAVDATEGQTQSAVVLAASADGSQFQRYEIPQTDVLEDDIQVFVDGVLWPQLESVVLAGPTEAAWQLEKDADDTLYVRFGDGVTGDIPIPGAVITTNYRVSLGALGNNGIGTITTMVTTFPENPSVTNTTLASGGGPPETIEAAKRRGPAEFKTLGRAVTLPDYAVLAEGVNGVAKTQAIIDGVVRVGIYVAPVGGGVASPALLSDVIDYMETLKMATDGVTAYSANYIGIQMIGTVHVLANYPQVGVQTAVRVALDEYFDLDNQEFGETGKPTGDVRISDVYGLIENVTGVDYVELSQLTMVPEAKWILKSGGAVFGAIVPNTTTVAETWTVTFVTPTTFNVRGSVSGLQVSMGTIGVAYVSDLQEVSFIITNAGVSMQALDRATFRVSEIEGSVLVFETEIAEEDTVTLAYSGGVT